MCSEPLVTVDTNNSISIVATNRYEGDCTEVMHSTGKRTVQVNVKMSAEDFETLQAAADRLWPDAILSRSGIILGSREWRRGTSSRKDL